MRTSKQTQQDILTCMEINISNARKPALRQFYEAQRSAYVASIKRRQDRAVKRTNAMERFADALCLENRPGQQP